MKRMVMKICLMMLAVGIFTGCGAADPAGETGSPNIVSSDVVSKGAVSGGAISGSAPSGKDVSITHLGQSLYENDDNWYDYQDGTSGEYAELIQYRLDKRTRVRGIKMEINRVEWVSNEWIYYTTWKDYDYEILWRIPIKKTKDGDRLLTEKKEKILEAEEICVDYVTDSYLILDLMEDSEGIYKYDLKTKKRKKLISGEGSASVLFVSDHYLDDQFVITQYGYGFMIEGELFAETSENLYLLNPETEKVTSICSLPGDEFIEYGFHRGEFYFATGNSLYRYNKDSRKAECIISEKKMIEAVEKLKSMKVKKLTLQEIIFHKDKMYLPFEMRWKKKNPDTGKETVYKRTELFYMKIGQPDRILHEDKLTNYLDKQGKFKKYDTKKGVPHYLHTCEYGSSGDGKIIFEIRDEEDEEGTIYYYYDIDTKKTEKLDWEDQEEREREKAVGTEYEQE